MAKIVIATDPDSKKVGVSKDLRGLTLGEASHILMELEIMKEDLMKRIVDLR